MAQIFNLNFRPSEIILDRVLNPARDQNIGAARPADIIEACGIIPDLFCAACCEAGTGDDGLTLDGVCAAMDNAYGFGGFCYPFGGSLELDGTYKSEHDDDADLAPLARFGFEGRVFCFVYDYGITAVRIGLDGPYKIARFD